MVAPYPNRIYPTREAFSDCFKKRVLHSFDDISQEADQIEKAEWERLGQYATEYTDPSDLAERAFQKGLEFYLTMSDMVQGIRNMFAAGLYHLFEQQLLLFHRQELLGFKEENDPKLFKVTEAARRLEDDHGVCVGRFRSWPKVEELRLLANTVKHAGGPSCEALKGWRPDLFRHPDVREFGMPFLPALDVFQPLSGKDIYVTDDDFDQYVVAAKGFWAELADALERQP